MPTVREETMRILRHLNVTKVFGNPGSTELPMFRDFPDDFDYVLGLQEASVAAMADGYALASGNAAFINLHSAAGTGHALGNIFTAFKNQAPIVVTAGQQARSILPFEPFLYAGRPTEFPQPYVKWACEPARAEDVPRAILRAYQIAMTPPRGPTFVSVPIDDWDQPCAPISIGEMHRGAPGDRVALTALAGELESARAPLLVLSAGVVRDGAWSAVIALAERQNIPVKVAPFASQNVFPEDHPLFQGFLNASRGAIVEELVPYDVVLSVGGPLNLYHTEENGPHVPEGTSVWAIDDNPNNLSWALADHTILADCRLALEALLEKVGENDRSAPLPLVRKSAPANDMLTDCQVLERLAERRPANSIIVEEAPSSRGPMHDHLPILRDKGFFTTASGGLGYSLPAAVGIAIAQPDDKVIALLGDGSAMYSIQGLFTAAQRNVPVSFLVLNNQRYEALHKFGRLFQLQDLPGTNLAGLDFCALAKGHGVEARRVEQLGEVDAVLDWSMSASNPTLVEFVIQ